MRKSEATYCADTLAACWSPNKKQEREKGKGRSWRSFRYFSVWQFLLCIVSEKHPCDAVLFDSGSKWNADFRAVSIGDLHFSWNLLCTHFGCEWIGADRQTDPSAIPGATVRHVLAPIPNGGGRFRAVQADLNPILDLLHRIKYDLSIGLVIDGHLFALSRRKGERIRLLKPFVCFSRHGIGQRSRLAEVGVRLKRR